MRSSTILSLAASLSTAAAVSQGFNYGSTNPDGTYAVQSDFEGRFNTAKNLVGTSGFTSARLYTMLQGGSSTNEPTQAIPAAISAGTTLLLGLWASGGQAGINGEIAALQNAITQYGDAFTKLVVGISVGSEDLYRISPTGIAADSGYGADPDVLVDYIGQVRANISSTALSGVGIGHVDTWTAWVNGSNDAVINAVDWIGMDAYPYFQSTEANDIGQGDSLFSAALAATQSAVGSKDVWITETGWPVSGKTSGSASPSLANAKTYWDQVGCPNFGKVNTYWYTLQDSDAASTPNPSFGIVGSTLSTTPLFDLSCSAVTSTASSASSAATAHTSSASSVVSSVASSIASEASSIVSVATSGAVASSGGGLSPSIGAGNGVNASSVTAPAGSTATETSGSGSSIPAVGGGGAATFTYTSGTGIYTSTRTAGSSTATGSSSGSSGSGSSGSGSGSSGNGTYTSSGTKPSSSSATTTGPVTVGTNAASILSGSFVGAIGAMLAAIAL
jgi:glucan endo-1,3-beta-D-glucosidase